MNIFNPKRFGRLLKYEILSDYKSWGIYFLTIVGVYLLFSMFNISTGGFINPNYMFPGFLFLGGFIVSSLSFEDTNDKFKNSLWFSLPGSSLEKYLVGALISTIGYLLFLCFSFFTASLLSRLVTTVVWGNGVPLFDPFYFGDDGLFLFFGYLVISPVFIVGSIVFKKAAFIKTVLTWVGVQTSYTIIGGIITKVILKTGTTMEWNNSRVEFFIDGNRLNNSQGLLVLAAGIIFALFFNFVGYLKLSEKEVKGGI